MSTNGLTYDYTLDELEAMPTLSQGQADDLKVEDDGVRIWLSRTGVEDGKPYNHAVTAEHLVDGAWIEVARWPAKVAR